MTTDKVKNEVLSMLTDEYIDTRDIIQKSKHSTTSVRASLIELKDERLAERRIIKRNAELKPPIREWRRA